MIGLAEPDLAFDEDDIEMTGKTESIDLSPLHLGASVGQQRQATATRSQPFDGVDGVVEGSKEAVAQLVVGVAYRSGQRLIVEADVFQREVRDLSTSRCQVETSHAMAFGIGPIPLAHTFD